MSLIRVSLFLYTVSVLISIVGILFAGMDKTNAEMNELLRNSTSVRDWLEDLNLKYNSTSTYNQNSEFGDFGTGLTIFLDIISGNSLASVLTFLPEWLTLIVRVVYIILTVAGIASWIANRWI